MADPDPHDDTSADYEQFEKALLAQDCDAAGVDTADTDDATARRLVDDLIDADVVTPVPEDRVLVHEPSGTIRIDGSNYNVATLWSANGPIRSYFDRGASQTLDGS